MASEERDGLIRRYAVGEITWSTLRDRGFENYVEVWARSANSASVPRSLPTQCRTWRRGNVAARSFASIESAASVNAPLSLIVAEASPLFMLVMKEHFYVQDMIVASNGDAPRT